MALVSKREDGEKQKRDDAEKQAEVWSLPPNAGMLEPASLSRLSFLTLSLHRFSNKQLASKANTMLPFFLLLDPIPFYSAPDRRLQST